MHLGLTVSMLSLGAALASCAKKKASDASSPAAAPASHIPHAGSSKLAVANWSTLPDLTSFLAAASATPSALWLDVAAARLNDDFNLVSGTPPTFKDIGASSANIRTYLTGDLSQVTTAIDSGRLAADWPTVKTKVASYFQADATCALMEKTARIISHLKADTASLCLFKGIASQGGKSLSVVSGNAIDNLAAVFAAAGDDKVIQINDTKATHMFAISGTTNLPSGFKLTMTTCDANHNPLSQRTVTVDNTIGAIDIVAKYIDPSDSSAVSSLKLDGSLITDGKGGYELDLAKQRILSFASSGSYGGVKASNQAQLVVSDNVLNVSLIETSSGTDSASHAVSGTERDALSVQYTGGGADDLVMYQGAAARTSSFTFTNTDGYNVSLNHSDHLAVAFNSGQAPQYAVLGASTFLDTVVSVDFAKDAILSLSAPSSADVTMDPRTCTATPATVLAYDKGANAALIDSCGNDLQKNNASMCDGLRAAKPTVFNAMFYRQSATGSAE